MKVYRVLTLSLGVFLASPPAEAAITFVGAGAQAVGTTNGAGVSCAYPTGYTKTTNDLGVLIVAGRPTDTTNPGAPSGWNLRTPSLREVGTNDLKIITYWRLIQTGDTAPSVTIPSTWSGTAAGLSCQMVIWRGVNTTTPFDVADVTGSSAAADPWTPASITTGTDGAWVVSAVATSDDNALALSSAQSFNVRVSGANYDTTTGGDHSVGLADKEQATVGTPTMPTWDQTVLASDLWASITFALRPTCYMTDLGYVGASTSNSTSVTLAFASSQVIILRKTEAQGNFTASDLPVDGTTYSTTVGGATVISNSGSALTSYPDSGLPAGKYYYRVVKKNGTCYAPGASQTGVTFTTGVPTGVGWSHGRSEGLMLEPGFTGDGKLYPSSSGTHIVAVDAGTGLDTSGWTNGAVTGSGSFEGSVTWVPLNAANAVVAADAGGKVYAVNAATGAKLWTEYQTAATGFKGGVAVQASRWANAAFKTQYGATTDIIFAASHNGASSTNNKVYAINAATGLPPAGWSFTDNLGAITKAPYVDYNRNRIYVATKASSGGTPTVQTRSTSKVDTEGTSHTVQLPDGIQTGDLLLVFFATGDLGASPNPQFPAGWTRFAFYNYSPDTSANCSIAVAYRQVDGTEGYNDSSTITVTTAAGAGNAASAHVALRITGHENPATQPPQGPTPNGVNDTNTPDPPALTPTGGPKNFLWIPAASTEDAVAITTPAPTNYTPLTTIANAASASATAIATAERLLNIATENPPQFTSSSTASVATTVAVHPAPAAPRSLWIINSLNGSSIACSPTTDCEMGVLDSSPTLSYDEQTLYVADTSGNLYAFTNLAGNPSRKWTGLSNSRFALGAGNGNVQGFAWEDYNYFLAGTPGRLYFTTTTGRVMCVQDSGTSAALCTDWLTNPRTISGVSTLFTPLLLDKLFAGGSDGRVHQIEVTGGAGVAGTVTGSKDIDLTGCSASAYSPPACAMGDVTTASQNELFVGSENGKLYKINLNSGALP